MIEANPNIVIILNVNGQILLANKDYQTEFLKILAICRLQESQLQHKDSKRLKLKVCKIICQAESY